MARTGYVSPLPEHEGTLSSGSFVHPLCIPLVLREIPAYVVISEKHLLEITILFLNCKHITIRLHKLTKGEYGDKMLQ